jgi:hypothetical protein
MKPRSNNVWEGVFGALDNVQQLALNFHSMTTKNKSSARAVHTCNILFQYNKDLRGDI